MTAAKQRLLYLIFIACFWGHYNLRAQSTFDIMVSGDYRGVTMIEMFMDLEKKYPVKFYYDPDVLPYYKLNYTCSNKSLFEVLQSMLPDNGLVCTGGRGNGIVICRKGDVNADYIRALVKKWEENKIELPEFLTPLQLNLQSGTAPAGTGKMTVKGQVVDAQSQDPVVGVSIIGKEPGLGAITDRQGAFSLSLLPGKHEFYLTYVGYRQTNISLEVFQSGSINIPLETRALELAGVEIQGNKAADKQKTTATGVELLTTQTIKELPSFMGESDVVKTLMILPGVTTVGEGASGFNVRGGNIDQNLVIQDELPFFNTSHVLGFFSVFNPDMVRSTTLYKGHIPARFGGRVASALDVRLRDGNYNKWEGSAGVGLAAAKATVEGPLWKDKVSVLIGARASYSDWMLKTAKLADVKNSSANFNDINAKLTARTGKNGTLSLGGHRSSDYFRYSQEFGYQWQTKGATLSWKQGWTDKFTTSLTAAAGQLQNTYFQPEGSDAFTLNNGLGFRNASFLANLLMLKGHEIQTGFQWNRTLSLPQELSPRGAGSGIEAKNIQSENGDELAAFVEDEINIGKSLRLSAGLRYSYFRSFGPANVYQYEPGVPNSTETIADTLHYAANQTTASYQGPEPRFSLNYRLNDKHSIKLTYNKLRQYIHLISNTTAATPADLWQVSNTYLLPQRCDNFAAGWFYTGNEGRYELSTEVFYRNIKDVPAYEDFARLLLNDHLETELISGKQRSYGSEFLVRKTRGRWTGWASYTWTRVWQQAKSPYPDLSVNRGNWFPANFDQPHQGIIFAKYAVNPALFWTFNFTYRTGRPVTAPQSAYQVGTVVIPNFSERNNLRIPDYHRLDLGFTIDKTRSKLSGLKWTLNFSMYNVYARKNPFSVFFRRDKKGLNKAYQLAVIGTTIPAVNLTFYW